MQTNFYTIAACRLCEGHQPKHSCHTLKVSNSLAAPCFDSPRVRRPALPSVWQVEDRMVLGGRKRYGRYREKHFIFSGACRRLRSAALTAPHPHCRRDRQTGRERPKGGGGVHGRGKNLSVRGAGGYDSITFRKQTVQAVRAVSAPPCRCSSVNARRQEFE